MYLKHLLSRLVPPFMGLVLLVVIWSLVSVTSTNNFPNPTDTFWQAVDVFSHPFYSNGPNDQMPTSSAKPMEGGTTRDNRFLKSMRCVLVRARSSEL